MKRFRLVGPLAIFCVLGAGVAKGATPAWMTTQYERSTRYLLANISPEGAARGAVVASPSKRDPDYFYHWVRDAGLVMDTVVDLYLRANGAEKARYFRMLEEYVDFSRGNQTTATPGGMGEPKFYANGHAFTGPWGRPQNDGPALRAVALIRLAKLWLAEGREKLVRQKLYDGALPAHTVIKADLEFVSHHWRETGFDLWEEVKGRHFYTLMAMRRALVDGSQLAILMGDGGAADWYLKQSRYIEGELGRFWDARRGYLVSMLDRDGGLDYKASNLDASVILAVMHGRTSDEFLSPSSDKVLATLHRQEETFRALYPVNQKGFPAVAIGRYPEDSYNGYETGKEGNPWVLLTIGFGELLHRAATEIQARGSLTVTSINGAFLANLLPTKKMSVGGTFQGADLARVLTALRAKGDDYIARGTFHGLSEGHLSEQIDKHSGYMRGAPDLTWNYAAFLTAYWQQK